MSKCTPKRCPTPSAPRRKLNTLWACPDCNQVFVLREYGGYGGTLRTWQETVLYVGAQQWL